MKQAQKQDQLIDGKSIAAALLDDIKHQVASLSRKPCLAVVLVGDNPASHVYVRNKIKACAQTGIISKEYKLPATAKLAEVDNLLETLNTNPEVDGILLQLPLPAGLDSDYLVQKINPAKDVDGLTIPNIGNLVAGRSGLVPCTPQGALRLIKSVKQDISGLHAVILGRSLLFGKPMAQLLLADNATVTTVHSKSADIPTLCRTADILVAAIGRPRMVQGDWIKPGAIVIDVGINRLDNGKICGDVDFDAALPYAGYITPVPGGVGPMTIACLMANTLKASGLGE